MSIHANQNLARRYFEDFCNARHLELASELFTPDYVYHDPQLPGVSGPKAMAETIKVYQDSVDGHWQIEDISGGEDGKVTVRWTGSGKHKRALPGLPIEPTGKTVKVSAISVFRIADGKIAEQWCVWDTLTFLRQLGAIPSN